MAFDEQGQVKKADVVVVVVVVVVVAVTSAAAEVASMNGDDRLSVITYRDVSNVIDMKLAVSLL